MNIHKKLSREERAKQFMPFAALKGHMEALRAKEKIIVEKKVLSEEAKAELDRTFAQIKRRDIITVVYFEKGEYVQLTGMVGHLDTVGRTIRVVNTVIGLDDINDLKVEVSK